MRQTDNLKHGDQTVQILKSTMENAQPQGALYGCCCLILIGNQAFRRQLFRGSLLKDLSERVSRVLRWRRVTRGCNADKGEGTGRYTDRSATLSRTAWTIPGLLALPRISARIGEIRLTSLWLHLSPPSLALGRKEGRPQTFCHDR